MHHIELYVFKSLLQQKNFIVISNDHVNYDVVFYVVVEIVQLVSLETLRIKGPCR